MRFSSGAHYIVGIVNDAKDGTSSNGLTISLWNTERGLEDNLTDIIGPYGNSKTNNVYMIDCEMLKNPCNVGDNLSVRVFNNGNNYVSDVKSVIVAGMGFDVVENLSLNSPPQIEEILVDDDFYLNPNEIDLIPASTKEIICRAIAIDYDGETNIKSVNSYFFDNIVSYYEDSNDHNYHYSNNSCFLNYSYGNENQVEIICIFNVWYYANSQSWNCSIKIYDEYSEIFGNDSVFVNPLLALEVLSPINFGKIGAKEISEEITINVTNYGNVKVNLSLSGYGGYENDGNSMVCTLGSTKNISINYEKFNLTNSNPGSINFSEFESKYINLTSYPKTKKFNLDYRRNDLENEAINSTYWRIYVPSGVAGSCQGNIIFGVVQNNEV